MTFILCDIFGPSPESECPFGSSLASGIDESAIFMFSRYATYFVPIAIVLVCLALDGMDRFRAPAAAIVSLGIALNVGLLTWRASARPELIPPGDLAVTFPRGGCAEFKNYWKGHSSGLNDMLARSQLPPMTTSILTDDEVIRRYLGSAPNAYFECAKEADDAARAP
jgi:hypothetical protein